MSVLFERITAFAANMIVGFYQLAARLTDGLAISLSVKTVIAAAFVVNIWTAAAALVLSAAMLVDLKTNKPSAPCFVGMCICASLAFFEILLSVICLPIAAVISFVHIVYIAYAAVSLVHIGTRRGILIRLAAAVEALLAAASFLLTAMLF